MLEAREPSWECPCGHGAAVRGAVDALQLACIQRLPLGAPVSTRCNAASFRPEAFLQYKNRFGTRKGAAAHESLF